MNAHPLISIVTPSYNQGRYLRETLESLVEQNYPNLEVIIQEGGSTDGAIAVAQEFVERYPQIFKLFVEKDSGQADALNRGFARVKGEILGYLNSDDILYPGCLSSVAREINPAQGRYLVMGRCLFTGEDSVYVGVEHPSYFASHFDQLAIWKRGYNTIPQPSVFWHKKVWEECGGFDVKESHVLDYDLFCRFSQRYRFHPVDELWSTYRMHAVSKSSQRTEPEILELSIQVSKRYWGSWFGLLRWKCEFSYWRYRRHNHEKARHHARRCEEAAKANQPSKATIEFFLTAWHSPKMARDRLLVPFAAAKRLRLLHRLLINQENHFTGRYEADRWIGPLYRDNLLVPKDACRLVLILQHAPQGKNHRALTVALSLNKNRVIERLFSEPGQYVLEAEVRGLQGRRCFIEMQSDSFFVPRFIHNVPDDRRLSIQLVETRFETLQEEFIDRDGMDGWIGPLYRRELFVPENGSSLELVLQHLPQGGKHQTVGVEVHLNQEAVTSRSYTKAGQYLVEIDVRKFRGRSLILEIRSDNYFVPAARPGALENRRRSMRLIAEKINSEADFRGLYEGDSYVSPSYRQELMIKSNATRLILVLKHTHQGESYRAVNVSLIVNQETVSTVQCTESGQYILEADVSKLRGQSSIIELRSDNHFVPHVVHAVPDYRQLSIQLVSTRVEPVE